MPAAARRLIAEAYARLLRVVRAPELPERAAQLADRRARREGSTKSREEVGVRLREPTDLGDGCLDRGGVATSAKRLRPLALSPLDRRVETMELHALRL